MLREVLEALAPRPGGLYLDATVGLGGHARAILEALAPAGRLLGLDQDPEALEIARQQLTRVVERHQWTVAEPFHLERANFAEVAVVLDRLRTLNRDGQDEQDRRLARDARLHPVHPVHPREIDSPGQPLLRGVLLDLGVSSLQLDRPERGFSFRAEGPLDMRMGPGRTRTAAELVNTLPEEELARIIREFGEERWSRRVAREIVRARQRQPFSTTSELAEVVSRAVPRTPRLGIHPATRTFQALRIAVNEELEVLPIALEVLIRRLEPGGRIVVLSYHSLEDRIVKHSFARLSGRCECPPRLPICACGAEALVQPLTRKPLTPSEEEVRANPRARSARLRVAERSTDNG
jgi:16S rRNA (cytosine1402-N4)-methyltransferase